MAIEGPGLGPELLVRLDRSAPEPLRSQLETSLREAIRDGRLRGGERLPPSRELARGLGVSRGMVQECYGQLLAEGYLTSRGGSATRVADIRERPERTAHPVPGSPVPRLTSGLIADFQPGLPDLSSFPRTDWAKAVRQACTEITTADLGYGDPHGSAELREVLAGYLRRGRAPPPPPRRASPRGSTWCCGPCTGNADCPRWPSKTPATGAPRTTRRSGPPWPSACGWSTCRSTRTAWWSARWPPAGPGRWWSPRPTSPPPGWCCRRPGGMRWSTGPSGPAAT